MGLRRRIALILPVLAITLHAYLSPDGKYYEAGNMVLGHGGGDPGVATNAQFFPQAGVGAILLVNTSAETDEFRQAFENLMGVLLHIASE